MAIISLTDFLNALHTIATYMLAIATLCVTASSYIAANSIVIIHIRIHIQFV